MPIAEFEEKQYETPANIELGFQHAGVFAAGQVLEAVVGYDVAAHQPQNAPIWKLVGGAAPSGLLLVPNLWQRATAQPQAPDLPSSFVSLILQYKRPMHLGRASAAQWHYWNRPYFRFPVLPHQQTTLEVLEASVGSQAVVRYACAAFWTYHQLQTHQHSREVLDHSAFVAPSTLHGHQVWTYDAPGTNGYANTRGKVIATEDFSSFLGQVRQRGRKREENLFQHLRGLAAGIGVPEITSDSAPRLLGKRLVQDELDHIQQQAVADTLGIGNRIGEVGASWFVVDLELVNP